MQLSNTALNTAITALVEIEEIGEVPEMIATLNELAIVAEEKGQADLTDVAEPWLQWIYAQVVTLANAVGPEHPAVAALTALTEA